MNGLEQELGSTQRGFAPRSFLVAVVLIPLLGLLSGCDEEILCIGIQTPGLWMYFDETLPSGTTITLTTNADIAPLPGVIECDVTHDCNAGLFFPYFRPPDVFVTITTPTDVFEDLQSPTYESGDGCTEPEYLGEVTIDVP